MEKPDSWKRVLSEKVADCRVFRVRRDTCIRDSDGKSSDFFVIENPDWVNIIAINKADEVVLIEQFRHGTEEIELELPGGLVDDGEAAEEAAKRELLEETGYSSNRWMMLGKSHPNPAIQNNTIYHYLALDCEKTSETAFDLHESITTKMVSRDMIGALIGDGSVTHSLVVAAFYYLSRTNENLL
jgi:ADP-ribose pyrophosphatase